MDRIYDIEQYDKLTNSIRRKNRNIVSNNYLIRENVREYIEQGLIWYSVSEGNLQLFIDQKKYYSMYLMADLNARVVLSNMDKPIVCSVISDESRGFEWWDKTTCESGFREAEYLKGLTSKSCEVLDKISLIVDSIETTLIKDGFSIERAKYSDKDAIDSFIESIPEIPYWDVVYRSEKDFCQDCDKGMIYMVVDNDRKICAASYSYARGKYEHSWIAVDKKYRDYYGMSTVLIKYRMIEMDKRGHMGHVWINVNNRKSYRYHTGIGMHPNNRLMKQYIIEPDQL